MYVQLLFKKHMVYSVWLTVICLDMNFVGDLCWFIVLL